MSKATFTKWATSARYRSVGAAVLVSANTCDDGLTHEAHTNASSTSVSQHGSASNPHHVTSPTEQLLGAKPCGSNVQSWRTLCSRPTCAAGGTDPWAVVAIKRRRWSARIAGAATLVLKHRRVPRKTSSRVTDHGRPWSTRHVPARSGAPQSACDAARKLPGVPSTPRACWLYLLTRLPPI